MQNTDETKNAVENTLLQDTSTINVLPNEIISLILLNNNIGDILRFSATCKRFNDLVLNDRSLWKNNFKETVSNEVAAIIEKETGNPDWLSEVKRYFVHRKNVYSELIGMSAQFYWRTSDVSLEDMRSVFEIALTDSLSYYYTIITLQDIIKNGRRNLERSKSEKPLTLTEMHYAKVALRHMIHTFLCIKWVKQHIKNELRPEVVVNFFVQWTDTNNLYPDEDVEDKIEEIFEEIEELLDKNYPSKTEPLDQRRSKGIIKERQILEAISQMIYHQLRMVVTPTANVENLNIVQVINSKCGNPIAVGAIYNAIAKKFGVNCDLVSFPNHFYLEWRELEGNKINLYTVDLKTGEIQPKRRCPFSQGGGADAKYKYNPDSLLQYIYAMFHMTMGAIKNWHTHNALHLLDFLGTDDNEHNPYRNFLPFLINSVHLPSLNITLDHRYLPAEHLETINKLATLNAPYSTVCRSMNVKEHCSNVKFAVGMICYHKRYDYVCIVRGWDFSCAVEWERRMETDYLEYGPKQPFYHVVAADQSERYVPQENLVEVMKPSRLYHLEDYIAREFTHFDGFSYVPNDEKMIEYPGDRPIAERYRTICYTKLNRARHESGSSAEGDDSNN